MMPLKVCLSTANTLMYPQGGHLWVFINWALGLRSCGCEVTWLDVAPTTLQIDELVAKYQDLRKTLHPFGLDANLIVDFSSSEDLTDRLHEVGLPSLESFGPFDLLVDLRYDLPQRLFANFRRKVLINIDPGLYELALARGAYPEPKHDLVFSIGESPGQSHDNRHWLHTPPCVFLDEWPFTLGSSDSPWTTVAHWWGEEAEDQDNSKREGFRAFMTIPSKVRAGFELALNVEHQEEQARIECYGFKVHDAHKIVSSPLDYRSFIQKSAGEFSCAKPSLVKLQTAWVSDRTLCYLASGKPCVVQNTGPSRFLPSDKGLHRFSDLNGAVKAISTVMENYESEARAARLLAEEFFDARKVCSSLLAHAL
jgi:hypothetical protein